MPVVCDMKRESSVSSGEEQSRKKRKPVFIKEYRGRFDDLFYSLGFYTEWDFPRDASWTQSLYLDCVVRTPLQETRGTCELGRVLQRERTCAGGARARREWSPLHAHLQRTLRGRRQCAVAHAASSPGVRR